MQITLHDEAGSLIAETTLAGYIRDHDLDRETVELIEHALYGNKPFTTERDGVELTLRRVPEPKPRPLSSWPIVPSEHLPSKRIDADRGAFEVAKWLVVARTASGYELRTEAKFYNVRGECDEREHVVSRHATLEEATGAFEAYPAVLRSEAA